jgi:hypothetical protein
LSPSELTSELTTLPECVCERRTAVRFGEEPSQTWFLAVRSAPRSKSKEIVSMQQ